MPISRPLRRHSADYGDGAERRGGVLVLVGLALFIVDLSVTNHGLPTAGAILALLAGSLVLLGAGVLYSGVLLAVLVVVAMLMRGLLFGVLGSLRSFKGRPAITGKEGMIGEAGTVRSPVGVNSEGWVFVHGERWRAVLAFAPRGVAPGDGEPVIGAGRKVMVVGFGDGGVVQHVASACSKRGLRCLAHPSPPSLERLTILPCLTAPPPNMVRYVGSEQA